MGLVVFSDLDGTLLDHHTYSYEAARPALAELARRGAPLVLCSSKTRAEMLPLWRELGLGAPFISENGGGVFAPREHPLAQEPGWQETAGGLMVRPLGMPISELRRRLAGFGRRFGARGFADLADAEVARLTGLSLAQAALARQREFNEPLLLAAEADGAGFAAAAQAAGLAVTRGGRFWHLLGGGDKGRAVRLVADYYRRGDAGLLTVGLGDSFNDRPMLAAVERAVQVARPDGSFAELDLPGVKRQQPPGPAGWNRAMLDILQEKAN